MKKNYKKLLVMLAFVSTAAFSQQTVLFDFGATPTIVPVGYNNLSDVATGAIPNLINSIESPTGFVYAVYDAFLDVNGTGSTAPTGAAAIFPVSATQDSLFTSEGHSGFFNRTGGFTLTGLDNAKFYSFEVFAGRAGVADIREAKYTVTGTTVVTGTLNASSNDSNTVLLNNVQPIGGQITFDMTDGSLNNHSLKYAYLGAIKMTESLTTLSVNNFFLDNNVAVYPNPASDFINIDYTLKNVAKSTISIYDISGRLIFEDKNGLNQAGNYSYKWNRKGTNGVSVTTGIYMLKITADENSVTKKLILK